MKGIRFYADLPGTMPDDGKWDTRYGEQPPLLPPRTTIKQLKEHADKGGALNCIALILGKEHQCVDYTQEALVATFSHADSNVSLGSVSRDYLRKCRRIPEALARKLHPRLFVRLDDSDWGGKENAA